MSLSSDYKTIKHKLNKEGLDYFFPVASKLTPVEVDFQKQENRGAHRTDEYEMQQLIVRRGQAFDITVTFNRDYNPDNDVIVVQFVTGIQYDGTYILNTTACQSLRLRF